jgi:serine O-acetyltransferase
MARYIAAQLNYTFPDENPIEAGALQEAVEAVEERAYRCFTGVRKKYFNEGDRVVFDHLHSDQYAMYLYMLAHDVYQRGAGDRLATKLYYLNKALHGVDIYFTTRLPETFLFVHPLGTILGRAQFADGLVVYQGCTVGCLNDGVFPTFVGPAILYANSSVLGKCRVGRNVCIAAGVSIIDTDVPDDTVALGHHPDYEFRPSTRALADRPPFAYGP